MVSYEGLSNVRAENSPAHAHDVQDGGELHVASLWSTTTLEGLLELLDGLCSWVTASPLYASPSYLET